MMDDFVGDVYQVESFLQDFEKPVVAGGLVGTSVSSRAAA